MLKEVESEKETLLQRKLDIEKEMDNHSTKPISYQLVRQVLNNFEKSLRTASSERQKTLLQLIIKDIIVNKDKKIEKVNLKFDEDIQKHYINSNTEESSNTEDSSIISRHSPKSYPSFMVRFSVSQANVVFHFILLYIFYIEETHYSHTFIGVSSIN